MKAESSVLQARAQKVGLRAFLFDRRVPGVLTLSAAHAGLADTPRTPVRGVPGPHSARLRQLGLAKKAQVRDTVSDPRTARPVAQALLWSLGLRSTDYNLYTLFRREEGTKAVRQVVAIPARPPGEEYKKKMPGAPYGHVAGRIIYPG